MAAASGSSIKEDPPSAGANRCLANGPALDRGRAGGNTYDDLRMEQPSSVMNLPNEMPNQILCNVKIREDTIAQREHLQNILRAPHKHLLCFYTHRHDLISNNGRANRDDRRLVQDNAPSLYVNQRVRRAEIDRDIGSKQAQHSAEHRLCPNFGRSMFVCDECEWALCRYFRIGKPHLLLINHVLVLIYAIGG